MATVSHRLSFWQGAKPERAAIVAVCLLILIAFGASDARADVRRASIDDLQIMMDTTFLSKPDAVILRSPGGYLPLIVDITNLGNDANVEVRVIPRASWGWTGGSQNSVRRSRVRRGETVRLIVPLIAPESQANNTYQGRMQLTVNGRQIDLARHMNAEFTVSTSTYSYGSATQQEWAATEISEESAGWDSLGTNKAIFMLNPSIMPANWIYYDITAPIFISRETLAGLRPELRSALVDLVAVGGRLVVTGVPGEHVPNVRRMLFGENRPASMNTTEYQNHVRDTFMLGDINYDPNPNALRDGGDSTYSRGARIHPRTIQAAMSGWSTTIPGLGRPPIVAFIVVMVLFTIIIGPVNYLLLKRKRKLELFLVTVPIISGLTTLFLFSYSIFREGLGTRGSVWSLTLLEEDGRKAVNFGMATYYAGLAPKGGLHFSHETSVVPMRQATDSLETHIIDWTDRQNLATNWIKPRTLTTFRTCTVSSSEGRLRLSISRDSEGNPIAVNGLGTAVSDLYVRMPGGEIYTLDSLKTGERARLNRVSVGDEGNERFQQRLERIAPLVGNALSQAPAGVYMCQTEDPIFLDKGVNKVKMDVSGFSLIGFFGSGE